MFSRPDGQRLRPTGDDRVSRDKRCDCGQATRLAAGAMRSDGGARKIAKSARSPGWTPCTHSELPSPLLSEINITRRYEPQVEFLAAPVMRVCELDAISERERCEAFACRRHANARQRHAETVVALSRRRGIARIIPPSGLERMLPVERFGERFAAGGRPCASGCARSNSRTRSAAGTLRNARRLPMLSALRREDPRDRDAYAHREIRLRVVMRFAQAVRRDGVAPK